MKKLLGSGITIVLLLAVIVGWAKVNNITDLNSGYNYFKALSDETWECGAGELEWNCELPGGNSASGPTTPGAEAPGVVGGDAGTTPTDPSAPASPPAKNALEEQLDAITVQDSEEVAYTRSEWKHWTGSPCNTRENILKAQGSNVTADPESCKITGGSWTDPYSGEVFTDASKLDIDHIAPLSWAAKNGGQKLSAEAKTAFANDAEGLYAVSASENRSKGDKGPADYLPPRDEFKCEYVATFLHMVTKYELTMNSADVAASRGVIRNNC